MVAPTRVDDFSCKACILQIPEQGTDPAPLLVALHGDSHDATEMFAAWSSVAQTHGAILFAPTCPKELGCPGGSWWRWFQSTGHDPAWLGAQLDAVRARLSVDTQRVYATGYSGGSSYLGFWAPTHSTELAAVGYVSGGYPYAQTCGRCKTPVRAVIGAADGMYEPYVKPLLRFFDECGGHEVSTRLVPRLGHKGMLAALPKGEAELLWSWFEGHHATCLDTIVDASVPSASDASTSIAPASSASVEASPAPIGAVEVGPTSRACACELASAPAAGAWPWALVLLTCVRALRPRTRRRPAHRAGPRRPV